MIQSYVMQRAAVFITLYALSMVFQLLAMGSVFYGFRGTAVGWSAIIEPALLVLSAWAVVEPTRRALLGIAALQALDALRMFPDIPNYRLITFGVSVTILCISLHQKLQRCSATTVQQDFFERVSRVLRLEFLAFYGCAAFHKLNTAFLDPSVSCGAAFYRRMASWFTLAPNTEWAATAAIHLTVVCELSIPVLLFFRRTRPWGIAVALLFHTALTLDVDQHVMDFTSLLIALLFLFTPDNWTTIAHATLAPPPNSWPVVLTRLRGLALAFIVIIVGTALFAPNPLWEWILRHLFWFGYAAVVLTAYLGAMPHRARFLPCPALFQMRPRWYTLFPLIVLLNGLGPYLGLRTRIAFDMYSNLRMEAPYPNHLLVPRSLDLFGWQSDRVQIVHSSDPYLQGLGQNGKELVYVRLRAYLAERPDVSAQIIRNGELQTISRAGNYRDFTNVPWALRSLIFFRPVDQLTAVRCDW